MRGCGAPYPPDGVTLGFVIPTTDLLTDDPSGIGIAVERYRWLETTDGWFAIPDDVDVTDVRRGLAVGTRASGERIIWPIDNPAAATVLEPPADAPAFLGLVGDDGTPALTYGTDTDRVVLVDPDSTPCRELTWPRPDDEWTLSGVDTAAGNWLVSSFIGDSIATVVVDNTGTPRGPDILLWAPGRLALAEIRGACWILDRWDPADGWVDAAHVVEDELATGAPLAPYRVDSDPPQDCPDIGLTGPGPDTIRIPTDSIEPGLHRLCHGAQPDEGVCAVVEFPEPA